MKTMMTWCFVGLTAILSVGCGSETQSESEDTDKYSKLPSRKTIELGDGVRLEMVLIPAGSFTMGANDGIDDEKPPHRVTVTKPFYLGKFEITIDQFDQFVKATSYETDAERGIGFQGAFGWNSETAEFKMNESYSWRNAGFTQSSDHPVVNISWNDAMAFCNWLSRKESKAYRLPTEAEWEYACRAGSTTPYAYGDDPEAAIKVANVADAAFEVEFPELKGIIQSDDGFVYTSPAGSFMPNSFGLCDMHGNVWEWCADWYDAQYYATSPTNDPTGPKTGEERVYRGGGWFNCTRGFRSSSRSGGLPDNRHLTLGFRVYGSVD